MLVPVVENNVGRNNQESEVGTVSNEVSSSLQAIELKLVLDAVQQCYGYDFHQYSEKVLRRRINAFIARCQLNHISELVPRLLHRTETMLQLLQTLSITVTEFFRDPVFFLAFREKIVPILRTYPFVCLWSAGCATGEEAYSLAILLEEEGLLERSRIYATDINSDALETAKSGVYESSCFDKACKNYLDAGGSNGFQRYCQQGYGSIKLSNHLLDHITFATHNLVQDGVFGEMAVISCRNVMIYFNILLKRHCMELFNQSLSNQGILCFGESESLITSNEQQCYKPIDRINKIYQRTHRVIFND